MGRDVMAGGRGQKAEGRRPYIYKIWNVEKDDNLKLVPCIPEVHGEFVRSLTRENFYNIVSRTISWNEELYQQEPRFPERYSMVQLQEEIIGFFCVRDAGDYLYIQLNIIFPSAICPLPLPSSTTDTIVRL